MDLSPAHLKGAREVFPEAEATLDRFHISKLLNEAVDQVRREEQKEQPELRHGLSPAAHPAGSTPGRGVAGAAPS